MIKLLKSLKKYGGFKPAVLEESTKSLCNPCRGWFVLKTFRIEEEPVFKSNEQEENLILILIDIGARRDKELDSDDFKRMEYIIDHYFERGYNLIFRVSYDSVGKGLEREPIAFKQVREHAEQIADFVRKNHEKIFLYQGLLVGSWGEMHSTKFASRERLSELNAVFNEKNGDLVFRAVRRPLQWRMLHKPALEGEKPEINKLGLFNDGMFGSDSDLGTFDSGNKDDLNWEKAWNRDKEISFISEISDEVPYGGEALFGEGFASGHRLEDYVAELAKKKVTYLNKHHDKKLIEWFKKETVKEKGIWNGVTYFDHIGSHLGYRFVIKKAAVYKESGGIYLEITVDNSGFARAYTDIEIVAYIEGKDSFTECVFEEYLNCCRPGESRTFRSTIITVTGKIFISARLVSGNRQVYFANNTSHNDGKIYIGEIEE